MPESLNLDRLGFPQTRDVRVAPLHQLSRAGRAGGSVRGSKRLAVARGHVDRTFPLEVFRGFVVIRP